MAAEYIVILWVVKKWCIVQVPSDSHCQGEWVVGCLKVSHVSLSCIFLHLQLRLYLYPRCNYLSYTLSCLRALSTDRSSQIYFSPHVANHIYNAFQIPRHRWNIPHNESTSKLALTNSSDHISNIPVVIGYNRDEVRILFPYPSSGITLAQCFATLESLGVNQYHILTNGTARQ